MRIIDADLYAADLWKLRENYQMLDDTHTADKIMHGIFRAEQELKEQPTVDAVPVCRCEKCRHWEETECFDGIPFGYCHRKTFADKKDSFHPRDFFCADGERKEG